jgi:hypothetical protein
MSTISRLATIAPEIHDILLSLPAERRTAVAKCAARWALDRVEHLEEPVIAWLEGGSRPELEALAARLDSEYFDRAEASNGQLDSLAMRAFSQARAASSAAFAVRGEAAEAVYEAAHSTDRLSEFRAFMLAEMHAV